MEETRERKKQEAQYWFSFLNNKVSRTETRYSTPVRLQENSQMQENHNDSNA